eukprot:796750_1
MVVVQQCYLKAIWLSCNKPLISTNLNIDRIPIQLCIHQSTNTTGFVLSCNCITWPISMALALSAYAIQYGIIMDLKKKYMFCHVRILRTYSNRSSQYCLPYHYSFLALTTPSINIPLV